MACLSCRNASFRRLYSLSGDPPAEIVACERCSLVQLEAPLGEAELEKLYQEGYFESAGAHAGYDDYASQEPEYMSTFAEEVRRIRAFAPSGKLLDVGCGYGYFVGQALEAGFDAFGIDLSRAAVAEASRRFPGRIFCGTLDAPELADRRFDVLFVSHLIEHILDPNAFVAALGRLLTPQGIVVLVTPNIESLLARFSGSRWVSFKTPEHVAYYSPRTLSAILENAGLEVLAVEPAYQHYRLPFLMGKVRALIRPLDRLVPHIEDWPGLRNSMLRVTSGSLRLFAAPRGRRPRAA